MALISSLIRSPFCKQSVWRVFSWWWQILYCFRARVKWNITFNCSKLQKFWKTNARKRNPFIFFLNVLWPFVYSRFGFRTWQSQNYKYCLQGYWWQKHAKIRWLLNMFDRHIQNEKKIWAIVQRRFIDELLSSRAHG